MTNEERRRQVELIRSRLVSIYVNGRAAGPLLYAASVQGVTDDIGFLLAELDAAQAAIHDLREESAAYRRGFAEGAAAEREQILGMAEGAFTGERFQLIRP